MVVSFLAGEGKFTFGNLFDKLQVIPCMALVVAFLGQKLRTISRKAHLSIANLSAYLNEVDLHCW